MFLKTYAIGLGVQAPTAEIRVVLEAPPQVDEGMYNYSPINYPDN